MAAKSPTTIDGPAKQFNLTLWRSPTGWRWRLKAKNGRTIAASTEGYTGKRGAIANIWDATGIQVKASVGLQRGQWHVFRHTDGLATTCWAVL